MINYNSFILILPEILLLCSTLIILLIDIFKRNHNITFIMSLLALFISTICLIVMQQFDFIDRIFNGSLVIDNFSQYLKILLCIITFISLIYSRAYVEDFNILSQGGDFYYLTLFSLLGQMIMVSSGNLLSIYLGLELMSLPLYAMIAMRRDYSKSIEAALKYFILGSIASAILLYGFSLVYGISNSLELVDLSAFIQGTISIEIVIFSLIFILAGLSFKLGVVPFHMWVPDVYQGSPTIITLLISTAPKIAAFAIMIRILFNSFVAFYLDWQSIIIIFSILSLAIGNIAAILQTNFKRVLAYSTISHMGFVLLGLIGVEPLEGSVAYIDSVFYIISYVITNMAIFGLLMFFSRANFDCENLDDLKGLNQVNPVMAFFMLICMLSLAGLPPFVGFYAKFSILRNLINSNHLYIAIYAILFSLIGAFYYLRVIKIVYFDNCNNNLSIIKSNNFYYSLIFKNLLIFNVLFIMIISFFPDILFNLCSKMTII
ncbi:MAG: NADH-quinone oxidoreductase subunit NuoN [Candidatus Kinetoplastibacterium crithidii]|nr:MAG: NADH-quinone oxidoreductase subunit NuoN [Candidatus Kinetoplastibacterium crithidii]